MDPRSPVDSVAGDGNTLPAYHNSSPSKTCYVNVTDSATQLTFVLTTSSGRSKYPDWFMMADMGNQSRLMCSGRLQWHRVPLSWEDLEYYLTCRQFTCSSEFMDNNTAKCFVAYLLCIYNDASGGSRLPFNITLEPFDSMTGFKTISVQQIRQHFNNTTSGRYWAESICDQPCVEEDSSAEMEDGYQDSDVDPVYSSISTSASPRQNVVMYDSEDDGDDYVKYPWIRTR